MKKLLAFFSAFVVTSSSAGSVVSCNDNKNNTTDGSNNDDTTENATLEELIQVYFKINTDEWNNENKELLSVFEENSGQNVYEATRTLYVNPFLKIDEKDVNNDLLDVQKIKNNETYLKFYTTSSRDNPYGCVVDAISHTLEMTKENIESIGWVMTDEEIKILNDLYTNTVEKYYKIWDENFR